MTRRKSENTGDEVTEEMTIGDIDALKQALAEEKEKAENYLANWQRAQADFINYKKRTEQERAEFSNVIRANVIYSLLPFLDDLERAFESVPPELANESWVEGVRLIARNFRATLESHGVTRIKALGEQFDPRIHEAVRQDKGEEGVIIEEVQKGYMLNDTLLRPAMVVVGNGEENQKEV
jgi:molecular chaperone GrpE